jgi:hypothetical protein
MRLFWVWDPDPLLCGLLKVCRRAWLKQTIDRNQPTPATIPLDQAFTFTPAVLERFSDRWGLVLFLAGFVIWSVIRISCSDLARPSATVPSIVEALMPTPVTPCLKPRRLRFNRHPLAWCLVNCRRW